MAWWMEPGILTVNNLLNGTQRVRKKAWVVMRASSPEFLCLWLSPLSHRRAGSLGLGAHTADGRLPSWHVCGGGCSDFLCPNPSSCAP